MVSRKTFLAALALVFGSALRALALTSNGNDFALSLVEAKTPAAQKQVLVGAVGRPHFFRYLQIMEMTEVTEGGVTGYKIVAFEPSSFLDVKFTVSMPVSIAKLREDPVSKPGLALAVTGQVAGVEPGTGAILLEQTIVRYKDRLSPKVGQELLGEVNPGATFYSYTEGPRPVLLEYRDRDLLVHRDAVLAQGGPKAWSGFLEKEIAARKKIRADAAKAAAAGK